MGLIGPMFSLDVLPKGDVQNKPLNSLPREP